MFHYAVDPEVTLKCRSTGDELDETPIHRVLWNDLITPLKHLRPTGPGGCGRGGRGQGHLGMHGEVTKPGCNFSRVFKIH